MALRGIRQDGDSGRFGNGLLQDLEVLADEFGGQPGQTCDIAAGVSEARHEPGSYGIGGIRHHDRNRSRHAPGGQGGFSNRHDKHVRFEPDEFGCELGHPIDVSLERSISVAILNSDVLSFNVAKLAEALLEGLHKAPGRWRRAEKTDCTDTRRRLRLTHEMRQRETQSKNEPDPPHGHLGEGWLAGV
jgi:hypothetical protein